MARRLIALWFPALATDRLYRAGAARDPALPLVTVDGQGGRLRLVAVDAAAAQAGLAP
ncbi:MAG: DNA polymerase Y family protein, partial [Alphaproteobacteria bacterium]|nr:DNA polymerase Y family protein [Alphaproteobacteria bacterium]